MRKNLPVIVLAIAVLLGHLLDERMLAVGLGLIGVAICEWLTKKR